MIVKTEYIKWTESDFVNVYYPDWLKVAFFQDFKYMGIKFGKKKYRILLSERIKKELYDYYKSSLTVGK